MPVAIMEVVQQTLGGLWYSIVTHSPLPVLRGRPTFQDRGPSLYTAPLLHTVLGQLVGSLIKQ